LETTRSEWQQHYDRKNPDRYVFGEVEKALSLIVSSINLEAGCGEGQVCFKYSQKGAYWVGVDLAKNALKKAVSKKHQIGSDNDFLVADVTHLPFRNNTFSCVVSLGVVEHFRDRLQVREAFIEAQRILQNKGNLLLTVPNIIVPVRNALTLFLSRNKIGIYHQLYAKNYLAKLASNCGFRVKVTVVNAWLPLFFIADGLMKNMGFSEGFRNKLYRLIENKNSFFLIKVFSGHILLIGEK
jgi:SAM-dependent methyltransferase